MKLSISHHENSLKSRKNALAREISEYTNQRMRIIKLTEAVAFLERQIAEAKRRGLESFDDERLLVRKKRAPLILALLALLVAAPAVYAEESHPQDVITSTDLDLACASRPRPTSQIAAWKRRAMVKMNADRHAAGLPPSSSRDWEYDHIIPRCSGGADDPSNLRLQRCDEWSGLSCISGPAHEKDMAERQMCRAICDWHTVPLAVGQKMMREWKDQE